MRWIYSLFGVSSKLQMSVFQGTCVLKYQIINADSFISKAKWIPRAQSFSIVLLNDNIIIES